MCVCCIFIKSLLTISHLSTYSNNTKILNIAYKPSFNLPTALTFKGLPSPASKSPFKQIKILEIVFKWASHKMPTHLSQVYRI